ncbi:hypothetical protein V1517DRAFT_321476 [Lipomyces orientalis]|uniref:Uncharacterized protein n=1 Tax=Lipomyces orientalis TaxID=1233043 RepID=A0ACC3TPI8_9ASCO
MATSSTVYADNMSARPPSMSRSDSALSSSSTVSTAASSSSSSSSSFARAVSPLSIGGSPLKLGKFTQNITMFDEKEGCLVVKSRPFDWSPLPWTQTEVPFDWWLNRVDRELEGGLRQRFDSDDGHEKESGVEHEQSEDEVQTRPAASMQSVNTTTSATENSSDAVRAAYGESVDDDKDSFYFCEEPEEMEQEYDSRGRPILRLLTTFKGGYGLDLTT